MMIAVSVFQSPVGYFRLQATESGLQSLLLNYVPDDAENIGSPSHPVLVMAHQQLQEYFAGIRKEFSVPLAMQGTEFQLADWQALGLERVYFMVHEPDDVSAPEMATRLAGDFTKALGSEVRFPRREIILPSDGQTRFDL